MQKILRNLPFHLETYHNNNSDGSSALQNLRKMQNKSELAKTFREFIPIINDTAHDNYAVFTGALRLTLEFNALEIWSLRYEQVVEKVERWDIVKGMVKNERALAVRDKLLDANSVKNLFYLSCFLAKCAYSKIRENMKTLQM